MSCTRVGIGGGYCDRDDVEYIEREESDDEIDDVSASDTLFACRTKQFSVTHDDGCFTTCYAVWEEEEEVQSQLKSFRKWQYRGMQPLCVLDLLI